MKTVTKELITLVAIIITSILLVFWAYLFHPIVAIFVFLACLFFGEGLLTAVLMKIEKGEEINENNLV